MHLCEISRCKIAFYNIGNNCFLSRNLFINAVIIKMVKVTNRGEILVKYFTDVKQCMFKDVDDFP